VLVLSDTNGAPGCCSEAGSGDISDTGSSCGAGATHVSVSLLNSVFCNSFFFIYFVSQIGSHAQVVSTK
jgi:hypothetical protein